jgi:hypothetical protein
MGAGLVRIVGAKWTDGERIDKELQILRLTEGTITLTKVELKPWKKKSLNQRNLVFSNK